MKRFCPSLTLKPGSICVSEATLSQESKCMLGTHTPSHTPVATSTPHFAVRDPVIPLCRMVTEAQGGRSLGQPWLCCSLLCPLSELVGGGGAGLLGGGPSGLPSARPQDQDCVAQSWGAGGGLGLWWVMEGAAAGE